MRQKIWIIGKYIVNLWSNFIIMKQTTIEKRVWNCYRELFANATPKGDFDKLVENATINERGEKEIPFMDYSLDEKTFMEILDKHAKKFRPKYMQKKFRTEILLGCSPKFGE